MVRQATPNPLVTRFAPDARAIGRRIRALRIARGMRYARELALRAGIPAGTLLAYENGDRVPCVANLAKLAIVLQVGIDRLVVGVPCWAHRAIERNLR